MIEKYKDFVGNIRDDVTKTMVIVATALVVPLVTVVGLTFVFDHPIKSILLLLVGNMVVKSCK